MKKTTKGALAASTAAVLLLGGAGSLAYWNAEDTVAGGVFDTGDLDLDFADCDAAEWTVTNEVEGVPPTAVDLTDFVVVPGDVFTKACEIQVVAIGDNIRASLGVTDGTATPSAGLSTANYDVTTSFLIGTEQLSEIDATNTAANGTDVIDVELTVNFPLRNVVDNTSKNQTLTLDDFTVAAVQAQTPATP